MGQPYQIVENKDSKQLADYLSHSGQALLPMVEQFVEVPGRGAAWVRRRWWRVRPRACARGRGG